MVHWVIPVLKGDLGPRCHVGGGWCIFVQVLDCILMKMHLVLVYEQL